MGSHAHGRTHKAHARHYPEIGHRVGDPVWPTGTTPGVPAQPTGTTPGVPTQPTGTKTPSPPSSNFDLSTWNLTLPTGEPNNPDVIPTSELENGYTSPYFYTGPDGAMTFWAPVNGVTTSGSHYPRSELRETRPDGSLYNWSVTAGTATLKATLAVTQVPSSGKVVVGQIHDDGSGGVSDEPLIKLVFEYSTSKGTASLVAEVRSTPTSSSNTDYTLAKGIGLNTRFTYQLQTLSNLTLEVSVNGVTSLTQGIDPSWEPQGFYFKVGSYVQANASDSAGGASVAIYSLGASHG